MKKIILFTTVVAIAVLGITLYQNRFSSSSNPLSTFKNPVNNTQEQNQEAVAVLVNNLEIPWSLAFLPDGRLMVTERPGRVQIIDENGAINLIAQIPVNSVGEGGLHGVT